MKPWPTAAIYESLWIMTIAVRQNSGEKKCETSLMPWSSEQHMQAVQDAGMIPTGNPNSFLHKKIWKSELNFDLIDNYWAAKETEESKRSN